MKRTLLGTACAALLLSHPFAHAQGSLENPQPNVVESGIGVISGWHCTSRAIEIRIDGTSLGLAGAGTARQDTQSVCGRSDTGFSLLYNFALLGPGTHRADAYANGVLFGTANFAVGSLGGEFLTGLLQSLSVTDFPARGQTSELRWAQSKQNFVIAGSAPSNAVSLVGTYVLAQVSIVYANGTVLSTSAPGTTATGTLEIRADGTASRTLRVSGPSGTVESSGTVAITDRGYYITAPTGMDVLTLGIVTRGSMLTMHAYDTSGRSDVLVWTRTP